MPVPAGLPFEGRWNRYSAWLRARYGCRVARVGVDGGFSCPNRRPDGTGGCSYCDTTGSRSPVLGLTRDIEEQVDRAAAFARGRYGAAALLLYFQAFTSTFAPAARLRELYDTALDRAAFRGLIVSTRPDCLDGEKADLLASYAERGAGRLGGAGLAELQRRHPGTHRPRPHGGGFRRGSEASARPGHPRSRPCRLRPSRGDGVRHVGHRALSRGPPGGRHKDPRSAHSLWMRAVRAGPGGRVHALVASAPPGSLRALAGVAAAPNRDPAPDDGHPCGPPGSAPETR